MGDTLCSLTCSADVAGGVRGPGDAVDARPVVVEAGYRCARNAYVQDNHLTETEAGKDNGNIKKTEYWENHTRQR